MCCEADGHLQRRRAQVRIAQRAYRNREKSLVSALRHDINDLQGKLIGMQNISDDWFELVTSVSSLSKDHKRRIQSLRRNEASFRLSASSRSAEVDLEKVRSDGLGQSSPTALAAPENDGRLSRLVDTVLSCRSRRLLSHKIKSLRASQRSKDSITRSKTFRQSFTESDWPLALIFGTSTRRRIESSLSPDRRLRHSLFHAP